MIVLAGRTKSEVDIESRKAEILALLTEYDKALPRPLELIVSLSPEAMAEVIDAIGTTRGSVLAKKTSLREELKSL